MNNINWLQMFEISVPIIVTVISIYIARYIEKQQSIEKEIRDEKIKIYGEFTKLVFEEVVGRKGKNLNVNKIEKFFPNFFNKLIFWGSDDVLKSFSIYMSTLYKQNESDNAMFLLENLLYAIRKDTGHGNKNLKKGDILRLFITDVDEFSDQTSKETTNNVTNN